VPIRNVTIGELLSPDRLSEVTPGTREKWFGTWAPSPHGAPLSFPPKKNPKSSAGPIIAAMARSAVFPVHDRAHPQRPSAAPAARGSTPVLLSCFRSNGVCSASEGTQVSASLKRLISIPIEPHLATLQFLFPQLFQLQYVYRRGGGAGDL
jgi:hypothetical protein